MIVNLYILGQKVDLYEDESINLNSSVLNIEDVTTNNTDYTLSFTVPASDNNNKLFKHYYYSAIDNVFDARIKQEAEIKLDGVTYKKGKVRLNRVNVKQNNPDSYTVNFWGELVNLVDLFGDDVLKDLDFSALDYSYDRDTVYDLVTGENPNKDLIYSLLSHDVLYYDNRTTGQNDKEGENVANISSNGSRGLGYTFMRPSVKSIKVIEAIEQKYNISFSRDFFGTTQFQELYTWFNGYTKEKSMPSGYTSVDWNAGSSRYIDLTTNVITYFPSVTGSIGLYSLYVNPKIGYETQPYEVVFDIDGRLISNRYTGDAVIFSEAIPVNIPFTVNIVPIGDDIEYDTNIIIEEYLGGELLHLDETFGYNQVAESRIEVSQIAPDIKVLDYINGLIKLFKLVVIPNGNTIEIDTVDNYYRRGKIIDLTKYVDFDSYKVSPVKIYSEVKYNFVDPTTILNQEYKNRNDKGYGDLENKITYNDLDPTQTNPNKIDGGVLEYAIPFEQFLYSRVENDTNGVDENINLQTGSIVDEGINYVKGGIHLHYNTLIRSDVDLLFTTDFPTPKYPFVVPTPNINCPINTIALDDSRYSNIVGLESNPYDNSLIVNTIYETNHRNYISNIFNIKSKIYSYNIIPRLADILNLRLNDIVKIKDTYHRINNYDVDLVSLTGSIELTNAIDLTLSNFEPDFTNIIADYNAQTQSVYITNLEPYTFVKVDLGFGVDWYTVTNSGNNLEVTFLENASGFNRSSRIDLTQGTKTIAIFVSQLTKAVTVDSTIITADTTLITADNG